MDDLQETCLPAFNDMFPVVFDKPQTVNTLANDPEEPGGSFPVTTDALFKAFATVTGGQFTFLLFECQRTSNYQYGNGKISLYAENGATDANGFFTGFIVGGAGVDNSRVIRKGQ